MIELALFQMPLYLPASLGSGGCAWGSMQGTCSKHTSPVARQPQTKEEGSNLPALSLGPSQPVMSWGMSFSCTDMQQEAGPSNEDGRVMVIKLPKGSFKDGRVV